MWFSPSQKHERNPKDPLQKDPQRLIRSLQETHENVKNRKKKINEK